MIKTWPYVFQCSRVFTGVRPVTQEALAATNIESTRAVASPLFVKNGRDSKIPPIEIRIAKPKLKTMGGFKLILLKILFIKLLFIITPIIITCSEILPS